VRKYKETNDENDLLEILKALEGIINTYTIIIAPGNATQQIHLNPYMKKFLGMFLSPAEQVNSTYQTYMQAVYRIRWICRHLSYEDVYSLVVLTLIDAIKRMKIVGTCDCIYYIQLVTKFKLHSFILKIARDSSVNIKDLPISFNKENDENTDEEYIDRASFKDEDYYYEDSLIDHMYESVDIDCLIRDDDIFKYLTYYEKYIIYLIDYLCLSRKNILNILRFEKLEDLEEKIDDIKYKIRVLGKQ
jgi:hypothetical protein